MLRNLNEEKFSIDPSKTMVVLSGGQDSTTCLFWTKHQQQAASRRFSKHGQIYSGEIRAICFDYGQKHKRELECARKVAELAGVPLDVISLGPILVGTSPLVNSKEKLGQYESVGELPGGIEPTFVPCRNALFLTVALNHALSHGISRLVTGVCEADYGGYPDCRYDFISAIEYALSEAVFGTNVGVRIVTPLMRLKKVQTVELAKMLPGCWEALKYTHTCYNGSPIPCGKCHACIIRARGFEEAGEVDPALALSS